MKKKVKKPIKEMYTPNLTYDIRWIQMFLKEKYAKLYSEIKDKGLQNSGTETK